MEYSILYSMGSLDLYFSRLCIFVMGVYAHLAAGNNIEFLNLVKLVSSNKLPFRLFLLVSSMVGLVSVCEGRNWGVLGAEYERVYNRL